MASAILNAEPSLLRDRDKNQLLPESYANAVEQNLNLGSSNEQIPPAQYTGQGEDDAPRSPRKKTHKKGGSLRMNGYQPPRRKETSIVVVEDFQDKDGEHLTGLKRNDTIELVSGRKAGAGWEKSQCEPPSGCI